MENFKFCPRCGSTQITLTHHHRLDCHHCHLVFYQNIATAVAVILEKEDHLLFTVREKEPKKGFLDLPGGFTDPDETAEESCIRELREELNLHLKVEDLHYFTSHPNQYAYGGITYKTEDLIFTGKLPDQWQVKLEKEEIQSIQWIKKSEINLNQIGFDSLRYAVEKYLKMHGLTL